MSRSRVGSSLRKASRIVTFDAADACQPISLARIRRCTYTASPQSGEHTASAEGLREHPLPASQPDMASTLPTVICPLWYISSTRYLADAIILSVHLIEAFRDTFVYHQLCRIWAVYNPVDLGHKLLVDFHHCTNRPCRSCCS